MSHSDLGAVLSAASACAREMMANASYVEKQLPTLGLAEPLRRQIHLVCSALVSAKHDIFTEVCELRELGEPPDSANAQRRVERIMAWLGEELPKLHALVVALEDVSQADRDIGSAYILVAESAANVYRAFNNVESAAEDYRKGLRENLGAAG